MTVFKDLEDARAYFRDDRFAMENGVVLEEIGDGCSVCSLALGDRHKNANGGVMGAAVFMLADFAFAAAANSRHRPTVTQQVSVNFLSGTRGSRLIARASCRKDGRTSCVYNIDVVDDLGRDIAQFNGVGCKL